MCSADSLVLVIRLVRRDTITLDGDVALSIAVGSPVADIVVAAFGLGAVSAQIVVAVEAIEAVRSIVSEEPLGPAICRQLVAESVAVASELPLSIRKYSAYTVHTIS